VIEKVEKIKREENRETEGRREGTDGALTEGATDAD
jgi:hypothetical protein